MIDRNSRRGRTVQSQFNCARRKVFHNRYLVERRLLDAFDVRRARMTTLALLESFQLAGERTE
jgi:hypothetical protein